MSLPADRAREHRSTTDAQRFLPTTMAECKARGWDAVDVVFVSGDAYLDQDAFAMLADKVQPLAIEHATASLATFSFDSGKLQCVQSLASRLHGEPTAAEATSLLAAFSFDSGRLEALQVMAPRWRQLPAAERQAVLATFSFDSNRKEARRLLQD